jgi:hypothetical protein
VENIATVTKDSSLWEEIQSNMSDKNLYLESRLEVNGEHKKFEHSLSWVLQWLNIWYVLGSKTI